MGDSQLVIVRRGHFATFELLSRTFADDHSVQIVWDRRMGERRRSAEGAGNGERRRSSGRRRTPPTEWGQLHYLVASESPQAS